MEGTMQILNQPLYKQKVDMDKIKVLNKLLQSKSNQLSKKMFSFEGKPVPANIKPELCTAPTVLPARDTIHDINNEVYQINSSGHIVVESIQHAYVNTGHIPSSLHLKNAIDSVFKLVVEGPIFIHDIQGCLLILEGHQIRLHNVRNSLVLIRSVQNNRIIIEKCNQLRINEGIEVDDFDFPTRESINPHFKRIDDTNCNHIVSSIDNVNEISIASGLLKKLICPEN